VAVIRNSRCRRRRDS